MEENKKLNILMATMQMGFGGAETHIYELCRALVRDGHTVTVASAGGRYADMLEAAGIRHVTLPLHTKNPLAVLRCRAALKKLIASEQFDVVHAHARIPAFICGSLQKQLHFRFVTTAHWVFRVTPLWKRLANWGDRQMAVSEDIKQHLIDNYGQFADNISVTVNGIDTDSFAPGGDFAAIRDELALSPSAHRIVSVSRMDESRGKAQLCLAKCAGRLLEKYPDLEIVIVGDGVLSAERNLLADVREIADTLEKKHGRKIIFTPGLRTDTPAFLGARSDELRAADRHCGQRGLHRHHGREPPRPRTEDQLLLPRLRRDHRGKALCRPLQTARHRTRSAPRDGRLLPPGHPRGLLRRADGARLRGDVRKSPRRHAGRAWQDFSQRLLRLR